MISLISLSNSNDNTIPKEEFSSSTAPYDIILSSDFHTLELSNKDVLPSSPCFCINLHKNFHRPYLLRVVLNPLWTLTIVVMNIINEANELFLKKKFEKAIEKYEIILSE